MKQYQRAALALAVLKLEKNDSVNSVYDYNQSTHPNISGHANDREIKLYDYDRGAFFDGSFNGTEFSLYDYEHCEFISLKKISDGKYEGYHYGSSSYFEITLRGNNVSFYDYGTGEFYDFS
ncbi:hypothetical protein [Acinetobacter bereziniae]|uniref:hypothetical protein n=1 Tax=Acinetobacter bereziniae TaxID=106648 RepID=UPI001250B710|nr:hypothetical protein [Acinetobacter bereziniae]MBJ9903650.1 hypothetical protein [Acinetobacter bereziniae]MCU4321660.1 hypothetical protein [Acinetobacter bereziniae]MCU4601312.1 hypothetical protein [Acinetobacter bereziniae]